MSIVTLSLMAALGYAGTEVLINLGTARLAPHEVQLIKTSITTICFLGLTFSHGKVIVPGKGASYLYLVICIFSGLCSFSGNLLKTKALANGGELGTVSSLTACYPAIAFVLSVLFMGEELKTNKIVGVTFAILSVLAFSYEPDGESKTKTA
mmetsp:Transcript_27501/g.41623  ORF Transcript_27501/g.41623 Transcript_27501/m.41623 type:complete len:152 (-) Transcript_27501:132-587(-)